MIAHPASDSVPSALLRFHHACAKRARDNLPHLPVFGSPASARLLKLTSAADGDVREIENRMVAIERLQSDPTAAAALLSESVVLVAQSRDEAAFEVIFRYFAPRLKSYFLRFGADASLAEEITQEALVLVWRNANQFDPLKASASTWIFTIARNLSIDRFRRARRPTFDPTDPAFVQEGEPPPDRQLERAETEKHVREVMNSLSANEKDVLMLSFYENSSHSEIAKRLGLPIGTVKSRIRLAFGKIREALDAQKGCVE